MGEFLIRSFDKAMEEIMTPSETRLAFWENMKEFIGVPYVYGGLRGSMALALTGTDCSGAVIAACEGALPGCTGGATYTGDMRECFTATGLWEWHEGTAGMVAGDVLLYDRKHPGHTGMYDGANVIEEYPPEGRCVPYYEYDGGWDGYLHYTGGVPEGDGEPYEYYGCGGRYRVTEQAAPYLNVRTMPSLAAATVASYLPGEIVNLEGLRTVADGYVWGRYEAYSGNTRYVAIAKADASETYLELV